MKRFFVAARQIFFSEATDQDTSVFCTGFFFEQFFTYFNQRYFLCNYDFKVMSYTVIISYEVSNSYKISISYKVNGLCIIYDIV